MVVSLVLVAIGLLLYFTANLPLMPYDALTYVIGKRFGLQLSRAKILTDSVNVVIAGAICLMFTRSLGAIGFGTFISVYFIGKILGWLIKLYQKPLKAWYV
ncbi:membrane protein [Geomicrobium sp. JCM 19055]|nr:membrane protein [Geomicrobium sp. JCM 19055]